MQMMMILMNTVAMAVVTPTSRAVAHGVLLRCARDGAFADRALATALSGDTLARNDKSLATELVYGVLRHTSSLDFALEQLAASNRTALQTTLALRIGAYELLHLRTPDHAAVHEAVSLVRPVAQRRFVNGVLRNLARRREVLRSPSDSALPPLAALAVTTSTPEWLLRALGERSSGGEDPLLATFDEVSAWAHATQERPPTEPGAVWQPAQQPGRVAVVIGAAGAEARFGARARLEALARLAASVALARLAASAASLAWYPGCTCSLVISSHVNCSPVAPPGSRRNVSTMIFGAGVAAAVAPPPSALRADSSSSSDASVRMEALAPGSSPDRWCAVVGNEDSGIGAAVRAACATPLRVDMAPGVDSVAITVATGIVLNGLREREAADRGW